jgi:hypothetical protein
MAVRELVSEFEARRVERMLRSLWPGLLRADEALRVLRGVEQAGWVEVTWELADQQRRSVYRVDARIERKGPVRGQELADRQAVERLYDLLGAQFEDHLKGDRQPFTGPRWEAAEFAGRQVFLRGQIRDEASESRAEALLEAAARGPDPTEP